MIPSKLDVDLRNSLVSALRANHEAEAALHEPSGKLSAGQLGKPLLEQVLKVIGVPQKPVDDYALGLFERGNSVEDNIIKLLQPDKTQVECEYRGCVGIIDAIKDNRIYEVKSVKNSQIPYLDPTNTTRRRGADGSMQRVYNGAKYAHALQGALYALAEGKDEFTILYASADDLRTYPHVIKTADIQAEVDTIITEVENAIASKKLPKWVAREDWQAKFPEYSGYPEWISLEPELAMEKLKNQYPDSYRKLTGGK